MTFCSFRRYLFNSYFDSEDNVVTAYKHFRITNNVLDGYAMKNFKIGLDFIY